MISNSRGGSRGPRLRASAACQPVVLPSKGVPREEYDRRVVAELQNRGVELVCLAGFMRLLTAEFCRAFPLRALNIHPSLLPAFPGLDAQKQALEHGAKISGCTVHFVDEAPGCGPDYFAGRRAGAGSTTRRKRWPRGFWWKSTAFIAKRSGSFCRGAGAWRAGA